jgi:AbrB family looped-hinge helix DNA binding protein
MEMNDEKTLRILGKRGRVTIPQEVRDAIGMARGDVVSFAVVSDDCALVKRERLCDNCVNEPPTMISLFVQAMHQAKSSPQSQRAFEFLTSLSPAQQLNAAAKIIADWAENSHEE